MRQGPSEKEQVVQLIKPTQSYIEWGKSDSEWTKGESEWSKKWIEQKVNWDLMNKEWKWIEQKSDSGWSGNEYIKSNYVIYAINRVILLRIANMVSIDLKSLISISIYIWYIFHKG